MRLTGLCANVDESILLLDFNVFFKDFDYNDDDKIRKFVNLVKRKFIQPFVSNLIGYLSESHLLHLPADVLLKLAEKLPFRSFFNLCLSCSTMWNDLYENDCIWKILLRRDFRDTKQHDCYRDRYIELYVAGSQRAQFRAHRPVERIYIPTERPAPPDGNVRPIKGAIGGPDDVHPQLNNPIPLLPQPRRLFPSPLVPRPGRPRIFPRHPAMQPKPQPRPDGPGFGGFL